MERGASTVRKKTHPASRTPVYGYIIRRILLMIPTILGVAILIFVLMRLIPGDIVLARMGGAMVDKASLQAERIRLGIDKPAWLQFVDWMRGMVVLDLGKSMWTGRPVVDEIAGRFPISLQVAIMATVLAVLISIPLGTIAALKQDTWVDYAVRMFSIAGLATPSFWLGILIILFFLIVFKWMPPLTYVSIWQDPIRNLSQLLWPALATGYRYSAVATRMTRSSVLEAMREDYIRTARAKGMVEHLKLLMAPEEDSRQPIEKAAATLADAIKSSSHMNGKKDATIAHRV